MERNINKYFNYSCTIYNIIRKVKMKKGIDSSKKDWKKAKDTWFAIYKLNSLWNKNLLSSILKNHIYNWFLR